MFIQSDNRSIFYLFLWFFENCFCLVDSLLIVFKTAFTSFRNLFIFLLKTIFSSVNSQVTRNLFYSFHNLLVSQHSHKKRKDILETRAVYVEISLCLNSTDKPAKEWWMYVKSNLKALKFQRKRYHFRLWFFYRFWMLLVLLLALMSISQVVTM